MDKNLFGHFLARTQEEEIWSFSIERKILSVGDIVFDLIEKSGDSFQDRIRHYCFWCFENNHDFSYDQIFFPEEKGEVASRNIEFKLENENIKIKVHQKMDYQEIIFHSLFDKRFLDSMTDAMLICDAATVKGLGPCIVFVNKKFCELTGFESEELIGKNPRILQGSGTEEAVKYKIRQALLDEVPIQANLTNYRKDGEQFEVELNISPVMDITNWCTHWVSIQRDASEDRKKVNELKADQFFFSKMQSIAHIGCWSLDIKSNSVWWSEEVYKIHGVEPGNSIEKETAIDFYEPHERPRLAKMINDAIENKIPFFGEFQFRDIEGNKKWVQSYGEPFRNERGEVDRIIGTFQDITHQKNTQLNLLKHNEELRTFKRGIDSYAIIAITDAKGKIQYVNDKFVEISGYNRLELIGSDHRIINSGYHSRDFFQNLWSTISSGKQWHGEIKNKKKNDGYYWVDTIITPQVAIDGTITGYISFRHDITDRKNNDLINDAVSTLRRKYLDYNAIGADFFSLMLKTLLEVSKFKYGFLFEKDIETDRGYVVNAKSSQISLEQIANHPELTTMMDFSSDLVEYQIKCEKFKIEEMNISCALMIPILANHQQVGKILLLEREECLNTESVRYLEPLFSGISEIYFHYIVEKEVIRQKELTLHQSKLASVGELAAGIGHEINNPLAVVISYIEKLRGQFNNSASEETLELFEKLDSALERIGNITNGLRKFSRMDTGDSEIFDVTVALNETIQMINEIYNREGITLIVKKVAQGNIFVTGPHGRLQQVFMNLFSNSRDAMAGLDNKSIIVSIDTDQDDVVLSFSDNGRGIPQDMKRKVFDAFYTTKNVGKGTGLGLSLSLSIVKEFGGMLNVESEINKGTTFKIRLPYQDNANMQAKKEVETDSGSLSNCRILLVDDEEGIREILGDILEETCEKVTSFSRAEDAYEEYCLNPDQYDIIISDVKMPGWNGTTFLKVLRENTDIKQPKFVFITGGVNINLEDGENELNSKFDGYIYKPFRRKDVESLLKKVMTEQN